jgi:DNA-binding protein YbaB
MSDDFDARLANLLTRTTQFTERLTASIENARPADATSELGGVKVSVNADSTLDRVEVFDGWRREAEPDTLGSLILATMGVAYGEQFGHWAELAPDVMDRPVPSPMPRPTSLGARPPRGAAGDRFTSDAMRSEGGLDQALGDLVASLKAATAHTVEGHDRGGHATATADGQGNVVGLVFDSDWLASATPHAIGSAATEAIASANSRGKSSTDLAAVIAASRLGRIHDHLIDPRPDGI